jgi:hypothetical protein
MIRGVLLSSSFYLLTIHLFTSSVTNSFLSVTESIDLGSARFILADDPFPGAEGMIVLLNVKEYFNIEGLYSA